jgi:hypothetical protein
MSVKAIPGQTCGVCRTALVETSANCPSCNKLDLRRLRINLARAFFPLFAASLFVFGGLAAATVYYNFSSIVGNLSASIDNQFAKPVSPKK